MDKLLAPKSRQMGGHEDRQMDGQFPSVFYRASSPFRGCYLAYITATIKQCKLHGKSTDDHLWPLGDWFLGCSPKGDKVLWNTENLYICTSSLHLSEHPSVPPETSSVLQEDGLGLPVLTKAC